MLNFSLDVVVSYKMCHREATSVKNWTVCAQWLVWSCLPHWVKARTHSCPLHLYVASPDTTVVAPKRSKKQVAFTCIYYASVHWMSSQENLVLSVTRFLALWSQPVCCPSECQRQVSTPVVLYTWMVKRRDSFGGSGPKAKNQKSMVGEKWPHIKRITEWFLDSTRVYNCSNFFSEIRVYFLQDLLSSDRSFRLSTQQEIFK